MNRSNILNYVLSLPLSDVWTAILISGARDTSNKIIETKLIIFKEQLKKHFHKMDFT